MRNGGLEIGRAVIPHAARELVAHLNAAAAHKAGMVEGYCTLFQTGDSHGNFPGGTRRVPTLHRPVNQRFLRIVQDGDVFRAAFLGAHARKEIGVKRRRGSKCEDLTVVWIQSHNNTALGSGIVQLLLGDHLQIEIDGRN